MTHPGHTPHRAHPRVPPEPSSRRGLASLFTRHLPLKAAAVFLAIVLWLVVNVKEPQVELVNVRFVPLLDSSVALRDPVPPIQALVAGTPRELIKLTSGSPFIRRQITTGIPDTLVVDLSPNDVILPDGVNAIVRDIQPRRVTLRFESTWTRTVPVRSALEFSPSNLPVSIAFEPQSVVVSGPRQIVARVGFVPTAMTLIPLPDSLPHLVDLDTSRAGIRVRPSQVKVRITPLPY
jgi:hypothetical protein